MRITPGRIVLYELSKDDADQVNRRRTTREAIAERSSAVYAMLGDAWPTGAQAHIGNPVASLPMVVVAAPGNPVAAFASLPMMVVVVAPDCVNGQVFLDGTDVLWVTNVPEGTGPGTWHWPEKITE